MMSSGMSAADVAVLTGNAGNSRGCNDGFGGEGWDGFGLSLSSQFLEAGEMVSADLEETAEDLILLVSRDTQRVVI